MLDHLRLPGGRLGTFSLVAALALGIVGIGMWSRCASRRPWASTSRSTTRPLQLVTAVFFGFIADGAVGFWIMDRRPWLGVVLAVFGCVIFTFILLWT